MNSSDEKLKQYRFIFGLSENYSREELRSAYATLARLNHPDKNPGADSLKNSFSETAYSGEQKDEIDPSYTIYKSGFSIMKQAFDEYFGETKPKINVGNRKVLSERLRNAKTSFSELVTTYPHSNWTSDAIDKIFSINKWLD